MPLSIKKKSVIARYLLEILAGETVLISYKARSGTIYTWYVSDNWLFLINFLITCAVVALIKWKRKKSRKLKNIRGGGGLENCIEYEKTYEIIDEDVKRIIKSLLQESSINHFLKEFFDSKGPLVVTPYLFLLANVVKDNLGAKIAILGFDLAFNNVKRAAVGFGGTIMLGITVMMFLETFIAKMILLGAGSAGVALFGLML